jgi:hypothetical protein
MTRRRGDVEVLPPNPRSNLPARVSLTPASVPAPIPAGDLLVRPFIRFGARSRAMTYTAVGAALRAESEATQADADLYRARVDRALAQAEYDDLPERLSQERYLRRLGRFQEIRNLEHEIALEELDHQVRVTRKSAELMHAVTDLTLARANCTAARQRLADSTQAYSAQLEYGDRHYELMWERKIGEETLHVEEQRAVLQEHRERVALADRTRARFHDSTIDLSAADSDDAAGEGKFARFRRPR